jgi:MFS family permease
VVALGLVSLLNDAASEMIFPLLPALVVALGGGPAFLGLIEGVAESTASLLKLGSGVLADRVRAKKPLVLVGYAIASVLRPLVAFATAPWHVLAVRFGDRVGKGVRASPRDALLAAAAPPAHRGLAFGFHRAMDHTGAFVGPLVAALLLGVAHLSVSTVFLLAAIPGALALLVLIFGVREPQGTPGGGAAALPVATGAAGAEPVPSVHDAPAGPAVAPAPDGGAPAAPARRPPLGATLWWLLGALVLFTLGNSSDVFLLLHAQRLGVPLGLLPVLWLVHHLVKAGLAGPGGALSDRVGRRPTILAGWLLYGLVYLGFGLARASWHVWALFAVYGVYYALVEGAEKALVADLAPAARRGTAFGAYHAALGLAALPASLVFGLLYQRVSPLAAFLVGAGCAAAAALVLVLQVRPRRPDRC